jgi:hypothetical protein
MERRKFTREFKLEAVRLIKDRGVSYAQASQDLGVHLSQLDLWRQAIAEGWLHVAAVVDLFSRRVVGWSMSAAMTAFAVRQQDRLHLLTEGAVYTPDGTQAAIGRKMVELPRCGAAFTVRGVLNPGLEPAEGSASFPASMISLPVLLQSSAMYVIGGTAADKP